MKPKISPTNHNKISPQDKPFACPSLKDFIACGRAQNAKQIEPIQPHTSNIWWRLPALPRSPSHCKCDALLNELSPHIKNVIVSLYQRQRNYKRKSSRDEQPTSLSSGNSKNHLLILHVLRNASVRCFPE